MADGIPRAACWLRPEQAEVIARTLRMAGIMPALAGSPEAVQTPGVARVLGCEPCDDLRLVLNAAPVDLVLIASAGVGGFGDTDVDQDLTALQLAKARGVVVATLDPIPAAAMELTGTRWVEALENGSLAELIRVVPRTRRTRMIDELHAAMETFGVLRTCSVRSQGPAVLGGLGARLFDAMDLVRTVMGVPETIDACFVAPANARGVHQLPGVSLRGLTGDLTAHLRFSDGRSGTLHLSDQCAASAFDLRALGAEGAITLTPQRMVWQGREGDLDTTDLPPSPEDSGEAALVTQLNSLCAGVGPTHAPIDYPSVLSMTHAALLSCRTGQGEAPDTIRRLMASA